MEPQQKLYLKIIVQAIEDYTDDVPVGTDKVHDTPERIKRQALVWFRDNSEDYKEVCDYAGINSQWLRKKVLTAKIVDLQGLLNEYRSLI